MYFCHSIHFTSFASKKGYEEFVRFYCFGFYDPVLRFV